ELIRMASRLTNISDYLASIGCFGMMFLVWIVSWIPFGSDDRNEDSPAELASVELDPESEAHTRIAGSVLSAWVRAGRSPEELDLILVQSTDLNAASFGSGGFVFWEGVAMLPSEAIDAIAAHEVAHDMLLHSRRTQDLTALTDFIAEVLS